jgi:diadenylate cyclase
MLGWLWESLQWNDVVDIGIMSYLLYRALLILKGTRALQSLVGLVAILGLYVLADQFEFVSLHWLLEKFLVYIVLAVIILFQKDIRRGLARAGGRLFVGGRSDPGNASMREELIKACFAMASRRVGALIAIERSADLDEFVERATVIDAVVSHELLSAIFHPTSPLHDGAVVVQKNRISAAQVFFPLSLSKEIARFFGTRHRAAIGLTEETDAVAIIVSEERGTVSLVVSGRIIPTANANELREQIQEIFQTSPDNREPEPTSDPEPDTDVQAKEV